MGGTGRRWGVLVVAVLLVLPACGAVEPAGAGDDGVLTSRAVAAVALDHLPQDTSARAATYEDELSPPGIVGAELRYRAGEGDDGDLVRVKVRPGDALEACSRTCADVGGGVRLEWELLAPEEDPGLVRLSVVRDGSLVEVLSSGSAIDGDPREIDLDPSYDALLAVVQDERLRLDPDAATLEAGRRLDDWDGGERDPRTLERVRNDDRTVVTEFVWAQVEGWRYVGPAPVKDVFGPDAIGGRVQIRRLGPIRGFVDALAAPQRPSWWEDCLPGFTCRQRGQDLFAWRVADGADPGEAWMVHLNDDGTAVALHTVGRRMPEGERQARTLAGFVLWGRSFWDRREPLSVGLTTTRESFEQNSARAGG